MPKVVIVDSHRDRGSSRREQKDPGYKYAGYDRRPDKAGEYDFVHNRELRRDYRDHYRPERGPTYFHDSHARRHSHDRRDDRHRDHSRHRDCSRHLDSGRDRGYEGLSSGFERLRITKDPSYDPRDGRRSYHDPAYVHGHYRSGYRP